MHHHLTRIGTTTAALAAGALLPAAFAAGQVQYRVIALTGETAPGTNAILDDIHAPRVTDAGQVAFFARLVNGDSVLYRSVYDDPATLELVLRTGDDVPGGPPSAAFGSGGAVRLNADGDLGFGMSVTGLGGDGDDGVFRFIDGEIETVALSGEQVPDAAAGVVYTAIWSPTMNAAGLLAFHSGLAGTNVDAANDRALFAHGIGGLNLIVREGFGAPGRPQDVFGSFGSPLIADNGRLAFFSYLNNDSDMGSVWTGWPGLLSTVMVAGEGVPNVGGFLGFSMSAAGTNVLTYAPTGFTRDLGKGLEQSATVGAPGPLGTYAWIDQFHMNTNTDGTLFFAARFDGPGDDANTALVHVDPNGDETVVVREGDEALGYWNDVEIDDLGSQAARVDFDDAGRLFFSVPLRGAAITPGNDHVLYARDLDGSVTPLLREGGILEVGDEDYRIVQDYSVSLGYGTRSGRRGPINEYGDIALTVRFNDGSEALVVAQLGAACSSDVNHDGFINVSDLIIVIANWGQTTPIGANGDTDRDGDVDVSDLIKLISDWGVCA